MDRRPEFENFPLSKEQYRQAMQEKANIQKQYMQNREQIMKISQKNIPQAGMFLQRLYERDRILQEQLNWIQQILRTNELLSAKRSIQQKHNTKAKLQSKQLINSYKQVVNDRKVKESFQRQKQKSQQLAILQINNQAIKDEYQREEEEKYRKKQALQAYIQEHNTQKQLKKQTMGNFNTRYQYKDSGLPKGTELADEYRRSQNIAKGYNEKQKSSVNVEQLLGSKETKLSKMGSYSIHS